MAVAAGPLVGALVGEAFSGALEVRQDANSGTVSIKINTVQNILRRDGMMILLKVQTLMTIRLKAIFNQET